MLLDSALRVFAATLVADIGGASGAVLGGLAANRLRALIWVAAGALLAVTLCDVLPEATEVIGWAPMALAAVSGYVSLWTVGRYVFHVCPACALDQLSDGSCLHVRRNVILFMVALAIHSTLDGIGIVAGEQMRRSADLPLLLGISLHKLPEGLALTLLLIGSGYRRGTAFLLCLAVESATVVGGLLGFGLLSQVSPAIIAGIAAHIAGGFLYLVGAIATAVHSDDEGRDRIRLVTFGTLSFLGTFGLILISAH